MRFGKTTRCLKKNRKMVKKDFRMKNSEANQLERKLDLLSDSFLFFAAGTVELVRAKTRARGPDFKTGLSLHQAYPKN